MTNIKNNNKNFEICNFSKIPIQLQLLTQKSIISLHTHAQEPYIY